MQKSEGSGFGRPNAFVESFNGKFREHCLNQHWFWDLIDVRRLVTSWRKHYNEIRPHSSLGYIAPETYARQAA